jgi:transposase
VQSTAQKNALHAANRKVVSSSLVKKVHQDMIQQIAKHIEEVDAEIRRLIDSNPTFKRDASLLDSIPGVGLILAAHLLIITQYSLEPRELSAYLGICPYEHKSGTSVNKKSTSRHYGPAATRKLLYLAACSMRTHRKEFKQYFLRKTAEGKPGKLVLNNIQNKLVRIACAVLRTQKPFMPNYVSINPVLLKKA